MKPQSSHLPWVDAIKAIALLWIVLNHIVERLFGSEYFANPSATWPPFSDRVSQLQPLVGHGAWDLLLNPLRYIGWAGDQGVGLFLVASGLGITWGLLARNGAEPLPWVDFYRRRFGRIYPLWWGAHAFFALTWLLTGWGIALTSRAAYASALGIRFTPGLFSYFAPAWWFIGLILQLYLVYPLLWELLRRRGPLWLLGVSVVAGVAARLAGLYLMPGFMPEWERGAFFLTRLPEFALGMCLAVLLARNTAAVLASIRSPGSVSLGVAVYALGTLLSFTLPGMAIAPLLTSAGAFLVLVAIFSAFEPAAWLTWVGRHSYSLYLMHYPVMVLLVPVGLTAGAFRIVADVCLMLLVTPALAVFLERAVGRATETLARWLRTTGVFGLTLRTAAVVALVVVPCLAGEIVVRKYWPQEVLGWGERPSLAADQTFGWRLEPSRSTRLRWDGYDYVVTANALGFPGQEYPASKPPSTFRILVTGDAFTSAEGVDTPRSWARLLGGQLGPAVGRDVQVMNFAITGYGPDQFAAVVSHFAPLYHPDLVVIQFFVKDYGDVLRSDAQFQQAIGLDRPLSEWKRIATLGDLHRLVQVRVFEPIGEFLTGAPRAQGYAWGNFAFFERSRADIRETAPPLVQRDLRIIRDASRRIGARLVIVMVPAAPQVCARGELPYYPAVDFGDAQRFDVDFPQSETARIAAELGIGFVDLRSALRSAGHCPYQPWNMHWTAEGHAFAAQAIAKALLDARYVPRSSVSRVLP